jgi:hypothetical protein
MLKHVDGENVDAVAKFDVPTGKMAHNVRCRSVQSIHHFERKCR